MLQRTRNTSAFTPLSRRFLRRPAEILAPELLGRYIVRTIDGGDSDSHGGGRATAERADRLVARIVEVEAYLGAPDRASHGWAGRATDRNRSLYLGGGHIYVYFIYGMHFCMNVVAGGTENGDAVLIRAAAPVEGLEAMALNRSRDKSAPIKPGDIAGGPGKLCQALRIDRRFDGVRLDRPPLQVTEGEPVAPDEVAAGPRIGVDYAGEAAAWPLRFAIRGHREMSRPRL